LFCLALSFRFSPFLDVSYFLFPILSFSKSPPRVLFSFLLFSLTRLYQRISI
jgi:hypothetical protein